MTVALSRARLGLYILGRREIFEACYELRQAFEQLLARPDKLMLVTGEMWPAERQLAGADRAEVPGEVCMEGVEHLGQYVYEMINTKVNQMQAEGAIPGEAEMDIQDTPFDDVEEVADEDADEDDDVGPEEAPANSEA